jgi:GTP pyrophosphokinase/guanosine-3',5'-bis(diphosphate) 3'-pyrophosphohydrolase
VKIHRSNCKNAHHLIRTDGDRVVDISWAKNIDTNFLGGIKVIGEDRVGLINDLTEVLSKSLQTNMKSINVSSEDGMFEGLITAYVNDLKHLEKIIKRIERVNGVKNATRFE